MFMGLFDDAEERLKHFANEIKDKVIDFLDVIEKLPLSKTDFPNLPAIPISLWEIPDTLLKLEHRSFATMQAKTGLSNIYTIKGQTYNGYSFLYDEKRKVEKQRRRDFLRTEVQLIRVPEIGKTILGVNLADRLGKNGYNNAMPVGKPINNLSLDSPEQFSISWTTFYNIYNGAQPYLPKWVDTLKDKTVATNEFWPTIARYGMAYNLLILQKLGSATKPSSQPNVIKAKFGSDWNNNWDQLLADGQLYMIDLSLFENLSPQMVRKNVRFTPATITLLQQDKITKQLIPIAVCVSGHKGVGKQVYTLANTNNFSWIYALQAAKCSITVYGIWLGHVYHWHIVTASLQMTMYNSLSETHNLYKLLAPQSDYLIPFNDVLLLLWQSAAPPTSISSAYMFLQFIDGYANGRGYYDDDPKVTLAANGINEDDFSVATKWDMYPIAGYFLQIWEATDGYVTKCVAEFYKTDGAVKKDRELQEWVTTAQSKNEGNVQGIGAVDTIDALNRFVISLVYRVSVHGCSRLNPSANPALTFVPNFPPCLQNADIPLPNAPLTLTDIMEYLPKTGTIGEMMTFYYTFGFSAPYKSFLPLSGNESELFFEPKQMEANESLITFRNAIQSFIEQYTHALKLPVSIAEAPQIYQWPLNIET